MFNLGKCPPINKSVSSMIVESTNNWLKLQKKDVVIKMDKNLKYLLTGRLEKEQTWNTYVSYHWSCNQTFQGY